MKKLPFLLSLLSALALLILCGFLCINYLNLNTDYQQLKSENGQLSTEYSKLTTEMANKDSYMQGQAEYITELTEQLHALQETTDSEDDEDDDSKDEDEESSPSYQTDYPELYAEGEYEKHQKDSQSKDDKVVYLTFDDGPSDLTPEVLDILDEYNAKATFFVVYKDDEEYTSYLKEIVDRGHTLALHSYSHDYNKIYKSVDAFLSDYEKVYDWVYEETGQRPTLYRFPGGSTNGSSAVVHDIIAEMERRGFIHYDWNVSSGDGSTLTTTENIIENVCSNVKYQKHPVVLMHDGPGKTPTLQALPDIMEFLSDSGYAFHALDEDLEPVQYRKNEQ